jgi:hypothetical protein
MVTGRMAPTMTRLLFALAALAAGLGSCDDVKGNGLVASGYFAGYHSNDFPVSAIPWSKYTDVK